MPDIIDRLAPADPSTAHPGWADAERRILEEVLTSDEVAPAGVRRGTSRRWWAGVAAAVALLTGVGLLMQLRPGSVPVAEPASPRPTVEQAPRATPDAEQAPTTQASTSVAPTASQQALWRTGGVIFEGDDGGQELCVGGILESLPPLCGGQKLNLTGKIPGDEKSLDYAFVSVEGHWDPTSNTFTVARRLPETSVPSGKEPVMFPGLCTDPVAGTARDRSPYTADNNETTIRKAAATIKGYKGAWVGSDQSFVNIAVQDDVAGAIAKLRPLVPGRFCVGTIQGPTTSQVAAARKALNRAGFKAVDEELTYGVSSISVPIAYQDDEQAMRIREAVGEEVWPFTRISFPIGRVGTDVDLPTRCGINELQLNGRWYQRDGGPLDDGEGNPPADWLNPTTRGTVVATGDRLTYTDAIGHYEFFTLRPGATEPLKVCS